MSYVLAFELASGLLWVVWELCCDICRIWTRRPEVRLQVMFVWCGVLATIAV